MKAEGQSARELYEKLMEQGIYVRYYQLPRLADMLRNHSRNGSGDGRGLCCPFPDDRATFLLAVSGKRKVKLAIIRNS